MINWIADYSYVIAPALAFLVAAGSPGPATLAVASTSMASGRRAGICLGFGLAAALAFWGVLTALGLAAFLIDWTPAMVALRIAGGLYLLYLGWKSAKSALSAETTSAHAIRATSGWGLFRRGVLLNLMNPKSVLAWTAVITVGLPIEAGAAQLIPIVIACVAMGFLVNLGYAALFSTARVMQGYARLRRWIDGVFSALFAAAGLKLILSRTETP